jgi:ubiquinone/menaquinone biosynthesis C-methylase UbiE
MYEATKAIKRRGKAQNDTYFSGSGIDIGAGPDCISKHGYDAYNWDMKDGDAQYLQSVKDNTYDFVHSSHCLEHMHDPRIAIKHWIRVCKPGGYVVIVIPDEELYEHNMWPSRFNSDHKWSFRIHTGNMLHAKSMNITDLIRYIWKDSEILSITRQETGFDFSLDKHIDQTIPADGPECSIEIILRKK